MLFPFRNLRTVTDIKLSTAPGRSPFFHRFGRLARGKVISVTVLTVDHIVPRTQGGGDALENLQLLCAACNSTKGTGTQAELLATLRRRGILTDG